MPPLETRSGAARVVGPAGRGVRAPHVSALPRGQNCGWCKNKGGNVNWGSVELDQAGGTHVHP